MRIFIDNLLRLRAEKGITQEELGLKCDMASSEISRFECGRREPRLHTMVRLARGLEVEPMELLRTD
jgi:transcriptional regulator with XRE-family HTH domain